MPDEKINKNYVLFEHGILILDRTEVYDISAHFYIQFWSRLCILNFALKVNMEK